MPNADASMDAALAQQIVSNWLDDEYEPSPDAIRTNNCRALVVADVINPMEAEWLSGAIHEIGITDVIGVAFEYNCRPILQSLLADRDSILAFNFDNGYRYALLTDRSRSFLFYKDQANRFCVLSGPSSFLRTAYPCSYDTAKTMYDDWANDEFKTEEERQEFSRVWSKYAELKPDE